VTGHQRGDQDGVGNDGDHYCGLNKCS
jgi:hypothetical protein